MPVETDRNTPLAGRTAVITGAGSGIGLATARLFATAGARLALVDRADPQPLQQAFPDALCLTGDVGDPDAVAEHARAIKDRFGRMDILVTAAGWSDGKTVAQGDYPSWTAVLNTVLDGTFLWAHQAVTQMAEHGGSIVFVGSQLALSGGRNNAAIPGAIDTPLLARGFARSADPDAAKARSMARHALGRLGRPEEVAEAILFLASDRASCTTGSCMMVEGGWLAG